MIPERRSNKFVERLSLWLIVISAIGTMIVLVDPVITFQTAAGTTIHIGGQGFSDQIKGAVISLILVSGFAGVISYWLGASAGSDKKSDTIAAQVANAASSDSSTTGDSK